MENEVEQILQGMSYGVNWEQEDGMRMEKEHWEWDVDGDGDEVHGMGMRQWGRGGDGSNVRHHVTLY